MLRKCTVTVLLVLSATLASGWVVSAPHLATAASFDSGPGEPPARARMAKAALVIANANYPANPLRNPLQDARIMDSLLRGMGFTVDRLTNGSRDEMQAAIERFVAQLQEEGTGILYFSGHGLESGGDSFLLPIDADFRSESALRASGVDLRAVIKAMSASRESRQDLVILDMCRKRWPPQGSADAAPLRAHPLRPPAGVLIAYATGAGGSADDGNGSAGVYTAALVREMAVPGRQATKVFKRATAAVGSQTGQRQVPEFASALTQPVYLGLPTAIMTQGTLPTAVLASSGFAQRSRGIIPESGEARYELLFWESIKDSDQAADYEAYLEAFPNGRFAPLARARASYFRDKDKASGAPGMPAIDTSPPAKEEDFQLEPMRGDYAAVVTANVRERPAADAPRIATVKKGSRVQVTGRVADRNWFQISMADGKKGFVYGTLIQPVTTPTAPTPPVPRSLPSAPPPSQPTPRQGEPLKVSRDCPDCPEMVVLPTGRFTMGAAEGDPSERPPHSVTIRQPFAIGKYEVTVSQWRACVVAGGCTYRAQEAGSKEELPVRDVSWDDAQQYVKWLSSATAGRYRLPTEAEWEYAARAGTQTRYWWGNAMAGGKANCKDCGGQWDRLAPAAVGSYPPNPFGLYDLNGNVWEWVSDCWHRSYDGAPSDERSWEDKDCSQRVLRGGSWRNDATYVLSTSRFYYDADVRYGLHGFRVAKSLP